jgi:sec-independent protein translocase protein TatC
MEKKLTILEHLEELRRRIIIILACLFFSSFFCFFFASFFLKVLRYPVRHYIPELFYFSPLDTILIYMRLAFLGGMILSLPVILYQVWGFIAPAIDENFRRYGIKFILSSFFAFYLGTIFGYFVVLPYFLRFLLSLGRDILKPLISAVSYIGFATNIIVGCGIIFELPVLVVILTKLGIVNHNFLRKKRRWAILFIFIFSAIITPTTDAFSMLVFALPLILLYEISIILSFILRR